jgi:hypothetical protein
MSKKKRSKRTRGRCNESVAVSRRERVWSDVEEAFFATAPPDQAEPPAPPESFDDLLPIPAPHQAERTRTPFGAFLLIPAAREAATWARGAGRGVRPSAAAIALASVVMLLALTAVVFASLG